MKTIQEILNKIDELGWSVDEHDDFYEFGKYSPAEQNFRITIYSKESSEDFIDQIYDRYNEFDVSEEAYLWLDETGHGTNGAPYDMKDVYEDMEWCKETILELYEDLKDWINN